MHSLGSAVVLVVLVGCNWSSTPAPGPAMPPGGVDAAATLPEPEPDAAPPAEPAPDAAPPRTARWRVVTSDERAARELVSISGSSRNDVWAISENGYVLNFDGGSWAKVAMSPALGLNAIFALNTRDVLIGAAAGRVFRFDGTDFNLSERLGEGPVRAIWGSAPDAIWIAGDFGFANNDLVFWNGKIWDLNNAQGSGPGNRVRGLWGSAANDVWAVGTANVAHFDGAQWDLVSTPRLLEGGLAAVCGSGRNDVWAVGDRMVQHWDGGAWQEVSPGAYGTRFMGVWGSGRNDVWIVGAGGMIMHSAGNQIFLTVDSGTTADLHAIWGSSATDVWVVGSGATILHYAVD